MSRDDRIDLATEEVMNRFDAVVAGLPHDDYRDVAAQLWTAFETLTRAADAETKAST